MLSSHRQTTPFKPLLLQISNNVQTAKKLAANAGIVRNVHLVVDDVRSSSGKNTTITYIQWSGSKGSTGIIANSAQKICSDS